MMIVISIMQALFSLSLCVAIIQMNTPKHYCRGVAIVWTFFVPDILLHIWCVEFIKVVKWCQQHHWRELLQTFFPSLAHKLKHRHDMIRALALHEMKWLQHVPSGWACRLHFTCAQHDLMEHSESKSIWSVKHTNSRLKYGALAENVWRTIQG